MALKDKYPCSGCKKVLPVSFFWIDSRTNTRKNSRCKDCYKDYRKDLDKNKAARVTEQDMENIRNKKYKCKKCKEERKGKHFYIKKTGIIDTSKCKDCYAEQYAKRTSPFTIRKKRETREKAAKTRQEKKQNFRSSLENRVKQLENI